MKKIILALLPALAAPVQAADDAALSCTLLQDNAARLACFDTVYAAQFPPRNPIAGPEVAQQQPKGVDIEKSYQASRAQKSPQVVFDEQQAKLISDAADAYTPLSLLFDLDKNDERGILSVREHQPMYLIPAWYNSSPNRYPHSPSRGVADNEVQSQQKRLEAKLQVSFKTKLMEDLFKTRADLWFGYTQQSNWQVYNQGRKSAPFRNNDYSPEFMLTQPVKAVLPFGGKLRMVGIGYLHQSNGQSQPLSRSWNRVYAMAGMEWGRLTVTPRVWTRIDKKGEDDDNPDITDYMGYGDLKLNYRFNDRHTVSSLLRYNPRSGKGALQLDYTFPLKGKLKAYVQAFHGYGENLIDYNHKQNAIGIGVVFRDWDGL